ncbi:putative lactoylglutathione lyase [Pedobacter sp. CAN_A7]|uniref:VOC family protein n=1 Tax=Pedobacter sp. CAN_A7 TaxID=2787722 RepID=UPI0018C9076B
MKTKQVWANLAVSDLRRTDQFYSDLGFKRNGKNESNELVSFFFADNQFIIHFFEKSKLESATGMTLADLRNGYEIMFSLSAETKDDVYQWYKLVQDAGGTIHREPSEDAQGFFWFVFSDPDGHRYNVLLVEDGM